MATFFGSDTTCVSDVPLIDLQITDPRVLIGQRVARRLQTPRGGLASIGDNPDGGWDCRQYVNMKLAPGDIATAQGQIQNECLKDEAVQSAVVTMIQAGSVLTITIRLLSAVGPLTLTMNVQQLTVEAIFSF